MTVEVKIGEVSVVIDRGMVEVVKRLNELGFKTVSSCSGLGVDHRDGRRAERIASVTVEGRRPELIEIAESCRWDWSLNGKESPSGNCASYVTFSSFQGCVHKFTADARDKRQTPSTREDALGSTLPLESTSMYTEPEDEEPNKDRFLQRQITHLLKAIALYTRRRETGSFSATEESTDNCGECSQPS